MSITTILLLLLGIALVVIGSNYLIDGASDIARRSGLSEFLIGLTIVGIGTSTPEMVVSFISAFRGSSDMSVGNIIGSNIFNTFLILGVSAVILPIAITKDNIRKDIPLNIAATALLIILGMNHSLFGTGNSDMISRLDGALMLICFVLYMYSSFKSGHTDTDNCSETNVLPTTNKPVLLSVFMIVGSLAALIIGGNLFVDNASLLARHFGMSDKLIGISILAVGTSLPELATCVAAAVKKKGQMALGNIIGSNIANILLILGGSALIHPLDMSNINVTDLGFVMLSVLFLLASYFTFTKKTLDRVEGVALLALAGIYFYLLFTAN